MIPIPPFMGGRRRDDPLIDFFHKTGGPVPAEPLHITAEDGSIVSYDDIPSEREVFITAKQGSRIEQKDLEAEQQQKGKLISPLSEAVSEYVWRTTHWLLFIPSRLGIDIEVQYQISGESRSQVVSTLIDIKPPIESIVFGGIVGGIIGSLARSFTEADSVTIDTRFFVKLIGSCLLSMMAVISLSRKSGSQSFVTVEDFFGAFVLGSLIGYQGTSFFEKTVVSPKSTGPATPS